MGNTMSMRVPFVGLPTVVFAELPHENVIGKAVGVLDLRIAGYFMMSHGARTGFSCLDQRAADPLPLPCRLDIPALDERHRR
jgi:hypothetical protein